MLILESIQKAFVDVSVLYDLNYTFEKGKIYTILGRNGSGKTTLFNCIAGFLPIDSGRIVDEAGHDISLSDVGLVHTESYLPDFLTAFEFLTFFIDMHPNMSHVRSDVEDLLDSIQFSQTDRHRLIKDYSSGMKHKLQMLIVLMLKPKILLLDEPLTSFDLVASLEMKKFLLEMKKDTIMIVSTHILQIAKELSDELLILNDGALTHIDHLGVDEDILEETIMEMLHD